MTQATAQREQPRGGERGHEGVFLTHYTQLEKGLAGHGAGWLNRLRQEAIHRFSEMGFPTTKLEDWKYTSVAPLARVRFEPSRDGAAGLSAKKLASLVGSELGGVRLVAVNGRFVPDLSDLDRIPKGVRVASLAELLASGDAAVEANLGRYADWKNQHFVALNTALVNGGFFVEIERGAVVREPLHLLHLTVPGAAPAAAHPRVLIVAGPNSQATIVESYLCLGEGRYFNNAVTEVVLQENAVLDHYRLQRENEQAFHIATVQIHQERDTTYNSCNIVLGSALARNDVNAVLAGEGGHAELNGLYVVRRQQHVDNHTRLDHTKPHCTSHELYKGILDDQAVGVFNGAIIVRKDAQKTDSIQHNKNLLVSRDALINSKPQLEIFADDVKCTHGATVGQLDKETLFYLRSRGIDEATARSLLLYAFAGEVVEGLKVERLREVLHELIAGRLKGPAPPVEDV